MTEDKLEAWRLGRNLEHQNAPRVGNEPQRYKIVAADRAVVLSVKVRGSLNEGWVAQGGPFVYDEIWYQAVVK